MLVEYRVSLAYCFGSVHSNEKILLHFIIIKSNLFYKCLSPCIKIINIQKNFEFYLCSIADDQYKILTIFFVLSRVLTTL